MNDSERYRTPFCTFSCATPEDFCELVAILRGQKPINLAPLRDAVDDMTDSAKELDAARKAAEHS